MKNARGPRKSMLAALDIGGVCISLHFDACRKALGLEDGFPPVMNKLRVDFAEGRISEKEWLEGVFYVLRGRLARKRISEAWNMIVGEPIPGMPEAIDEALASGGEFAFLSDTSVSHVAQFRKTCGFSALARGAVFSYEVGARKPAAAMYETFERKFGKPALYVDDLQKNIDAALARGWRAARFTTPCNFIEAFRRSVA